MGRGAFSGARKGEGCFAPTIAQPRRKRERREKVGFSFPSKVASTGPRFRVLVNDCCVVGASWCGRRKFGRAAFAVHLFFAFFFGRSGRRTRERPILEALRNSVFSTDLTTNSVLTVSEQAANLVQRVTAATRGKFHVFPVLAKQQVSQVRAWFDGYIFADNLLAGVVLVKGLFCHRHGLPSTWRKSILRPLG